MNRTIIRGTITLAASLLTIALWVSQSSALPMSAYQVGQAMIIPLLVLVALVGIVQIFRGIRESNAKSTPQVSDQVEGFRVVSPEEASAMAEEYNIGSPFATGTSLPLEAIGHEIDFEAGVWRETALGGLLASVIMIGFGLSSLFIFPVGAILISGLGGMLGAFALISRRPYSGLAATFGNLAVLVTALSRILL